MSFNNLIHDLQQNHQQQRDAALARYHNLVRDAADDNLPDAATAQTILHDADKAPAELQADVETVLQHRRLRALVARKDETYEQRRQIDAAVEDKKASFKKQEAKHHEQLTALSAERRQVDKLIQEICAAENTLAAAMPDDEEERELKAERAELSHLVSPVGVVCRTAEDRSELDRRRSAARQRLCEINDRLNVIHAEKALSDADETVLLD